MKPSEKETLSVRQLAQDLSTFAIDRTDVKSFLATIPENCRSNLNAIEYELQILKILSVGWAISFFMPASDTNKQSLTQIFWEDIREISMNISTLATTTTGKQINYFDTLKNRLGTYLGILQERPDNHQNPAGMIGPAFARACDTEDDSHVILIGTKLFTQTLGAVKTVLNHVKIDDTTLN